MVNKNLIESLESLIDLIYNPGVINIDFADLRTILKGRGNLAFLNTLEESGKSRADKISEKILHNDLYQNNNFIAEKILFNIAGGPNLSMVEVEKISRKISERNPQSKIIFGISNSPKLKNKIKTTLLMTGSSVFGKVVKPETKFNEEVVIEEKKASAVIKKPKKIKKKKQEKQEKAVVSAGKNLVPVFNNIPVEQTSVISSAQLAIMEEQPKKKTIRRTAIEAKKIQETEENKRFLQEEEWEIPAFLRRGKI
jgi:cell division protein FtsZ